MSLLTSLLHKGERMDIQRARLLYSGCIAIEYGQFYIDTPGLDDDKDSEVDFPEPVAAFKGQDNGVCGAAQLGKLFFVTGIQNGTAAIDIQFYPAEPYIDTSYDEIVEVFFQRGKHAVSLCEWALEESYLLALPEGDYRIRYSITGMGKNYDDEEDWGEPVPGQKHLIQIWPSNNIKDSIIKVTSEVALYWHKEWGGQ